jgi:threonine/homoserine/homoserine lactone efflux protein
MPSPSLIALFAVAALVLLIIPGPVVIYTVTRSLAQGPAAGLASTLAVALGDFCHVLAATLGLSALLLSSAVAFTVVKYLGAAYLVYLGLRALLARAGGPLTAAVPPQRLRRVVSQGFLVSLLNPKTALFFLAFLPQFVEPARGPVAGQVLVFGALFVLLGAGTNSLYALLAGAIGRWLKGSARFRRLQRYATGGVYLGLGAWTALAGSDAR